MPNLTPASKVHRSDLAELARLAQNDLSLIFGDFDTAQTARDGLLDVLPRMVAIYGSAAATLGADWYDDLRDASPARGRFRAITAELPDRGAADALARWSVTPLFAPNPDYPTTYTKVSGGLQRLIVNADRESVRFSAVQDPQAGWVRRGVGECDWCQKYLDGEVHYVEGYDFKAHDHCRCIAEPVFG